MIRRRTALLTATISALSVSAAPAIAAGTPDNSVVSDVPAATTQVVEVTATSWRTSRARLRVWQRDSGGGWGRVLAARARLGANGLVPAAKRRQNTGTTPAGTFAFTHAFGIGPAPLGTQVAYRRVTARDYWVYDPLHPATYNRWVAGRASGAPWRLSEAEHLIRYRLEYRYALIIDYNHASGTQPPDTSAGGGIFLHVNGDGPTAGCVSVPKAKMARILTWLEPSSQARIVIRVRRS